MEKEGSQNRDFEKVALENDHSKASPDSEGRRETYDGGKKKILPWVF